SYHEGETAAHYKAKIGIYQELQALGLAASIEKRLLDPQGKLLCIADVYFQTPEGQRVAIEVQRSLISTEKLKQRFENYRSLGIYVLWVGLAQDLRHEFRQGIHHLKLNKMQQCMADNFDSKLYVWSQKHCGLVVAKVQSVEGFRTFKKPRYLVRYQGNDSYSDYFYAPVQVHDLVCSNRLEDGRAIERLLYQVEYRGLVDQYMKSLFLGGSGKPAKSFGNEIHVKAGCGIHSIKELFLGDMNDNPF
ncbi:MAG TPA: competence protein CoiA family protein, partial [Anaerovoracaceae bacterium]|nr:competence protein CoiA family protein [Anaerovoracaceae bacterium]